MKAPSLVRTGSVVQFNSAAPYSLHFRRFVVSIPCEQRQNIAEVVGRNVGKFATICSVLLALAGPAPAAEGWRAIDGDTIVSPAGTTVRIANIDSPEAPGKCKCEAECRRAEAATAYVRASLSLAERVELRPYHRSVDRYGRTLAYVILDGRDLGESLIARGLARKWEGRRRSWCQ